DTPGGGMNFFPAFGTTEVPPPPAEDGDEWFAGTAQAYAPLILAAALAANLFSAGLAQDAGTQDQSEFIATLQQQGPGQGQFLVLRTELPKVFVSYGTHEEYAPPVVAVVDDEAGLPTLLVWPASAPPRQLDDPSDLGSATWEADAAPSVRPWSWQNTFPALADQ